jgi:uncharacterized Fe-S cluster protein YjdI
MTEEQRFLRFNKSYTNGEITVFWAPRLCIHSGKCFNNLGEVFLPLEHPWVQMENATTQEIMDTVDLCPSGALTYEIKVD